MEKEGKGIWTLRVTKEVNNDFLVSLGKRLIALQYFCVHHVGKITEKPHVHIFLKSVYSEGSIRAGCRDFSLNSGKNGTYSLKRCYDQNMINYMCKTGSKYLLSWGFPDEQDFDYFQKEWVKHNSEIIEERKVKQKRLIERLLESSNPTMQRTQIGMQILLICEEEDYLVPNRTLFNQYVDTVYLRKSSDKCRARSNLLSRLLIEDQM